MNARAHTLDQVRAAYAAGAGWYDVCARAFTLGLEPRLRERLAHRLQLSSGDTVLDMACGTGLNFASLEKGIGPAGQIIGVDLSPAMLAEAGKKLAANGWTNVELVVADAGSFQLAESADAVLCTFAIGLMPEPDSVVRGMVAAARPGGRVLLLDGRLTARWYGLALNPLARCAGGPWVPGAVREQYWTARPWETLQALVRDFHYEEWLGGFLYVAWGRREEMS